MAALGYAAALAGAFGAAAAAAVQLMAEPLVALFTDSARADGAQVIEMGGQYLRSYVWDVFFAGVHFSFSGYFCARGKSGLSFLHNCLSIILVRLPGPIWPPPSSRTPCSPWAWPARGDLCCLISCV